MEAAAEEEEVVEVVVGRARVGALREVFVLL